MVALTLVACGGEDPPWSGMNWVEGVGWMEPNGTAGYRWVEGEGWVYWSSRGSGGGVGSPPPEAANPATIACKDYDGKTMMVQPKTITIHNNSEAETIYPVVATSATEVNQWVQACLRTTDPYPTTSVYKLYVNDGKGIPPGSSVTITLPLYSELSAGNYITWWNGGRVLLADRSERLRKKEDQLVNTPDGVTCEGSGVECALSIYSGGDQFPEDVYAQLSEYTFGDSIVPNGQDVRLLKPENVGYNISYVDHVYMPVAIGPRDNPYIGYSGSAQPISEFRKGINAFLGATADAPSSLGQGWPVYNIAGLKLPGGYNIFAQRNGTLVSADDLPVKPAGTNPPVLTVLKCLQGECSEEEKRTLRYGEAVQRMQNLWGSCVSWNGEDISTYVTERVSCPQELQDKMGVIKRFFEQNHRDYLQLYSTGTCKGDTPLKPTFNYWEAMMHIYGWVPFNEGCGSGANKLADTKIPDWDHAKAQSMYIHDLQYNYQQPGVIANPKLTFNPYVKLIHDDLKMNAYGFSVDDAVGFMSELGSGLVFAVGGTQGLENPAQFTYADGFSLAIGVPEAQKERVNTPLIKRYGVCAFGRDPMDLDCESDKQDVVMPGNSQIAGFRVGTVASYPIRVRFTDVNDRVYSFVVKEKFAACPADLNASQCPTNRARIFDNQDKVSCVVTDSKGVKHPKSDAWCVGANPNQQREKQLTKNYLSFPQPVDFMN